MVVVMGNKNSGTFLWQHGCVAGIVVLLVGRRGATRVRINNWLFKRFARWDIMYEETEEEEWCWERGDWGVSRCQLDKRVVGAII